MIKSSLERMGPRKMRTIISTTGTSVSGGIPFEDKANAYRLALRSRLGKLKENTSSWERFLDESSAETKSFRALQLGGGDELYLLHTDTSEGQVCAEVVAELASEEFDVEARLRRIIGLQVKNSVVFRRQGINSLFAVLKDITGPIEHQQDHKVVLNITGGFKSVVPYVTLFGLLHRFDIAYIFEFSPALITLPPVPIHFDFERIGQAAEAIRQMQIHGVMQIEDFFRLIPGLPYAEKPFFESLLELEDDGNATLSAIAQQLLVASEEDRLTVLIGPHAKRSLDDAAGIARIQFLFMLHRVPDPLWRKSKYHRFEGTDLMVFKPGGTGQRMAAFIQGRNLHGAELYRDHETYERDLPGRRQSDYNRSDFELWIPPPDSEVLPETEEALYEKTLHEYEKRATNCEARLKDSESAWEAAQGEADALRVQCSELASERDRARSQESRLSEELSRLELMVASVQSELQLVRRPWWKRFILRKGRS
jgi:putative CRISPR-associated protein (TIGR02619 family)